MECNQGVSLILTVFGNEQGVLMSTCICYFRHLSVSSDPTSPMHLLRSGGLQSKLLVGFCPPCRWEVLFLLSRVVFLSDSGLHAGGKIVLLRKWGRNSAISEFLLQWVSVFLTAASNSCVQVSGHVSALLLPLTRVLDGWVLFWPSKILYVCFELCMIDGCCFPQYSL